MQHFTYKIFSLSAIGLANLTFAITDGEFNHLRVKRDADGELYTINVPENDPYLCPSLVTGTISEPDHEKSTRPPNPLLGNFLNTQAFNGRSLGNDVQTYEWEGQFHQEIPMTDALRQEFLDVHNKYRDQAASGELTGDPANRAKKLGVLEWDMDLERNAQAFANKCHWGHSSPLGWNNVPYNVGENLYISSKNGESKFGNGFIDLPEESIWPFVGEWVDYNHREGTCDSGKVCGHYTMVMAQGTTRMACAAAECNEVPNISWSTTYAPITYVVCQYIANTDRMYDYSTDGSVGSECESMDSTWTNLCASKDNICSNPSHNDRCQGNDSTCSATTQLNGIDSDFECTCDDTRSGRWCQDDLCSQVTINGKQASMNDVIRINDQGYFSYYTSEATALSRCATFVDNGFSSECKGVTYAFLSWANLKVWLLLDNIDLSTASDWSEGKIIYRDCSDPSPTTTQQVTTTTQAPTTTTTTAATTTQPSNNQGGICSANQIQVAGICRDASNAVTCGDVSTDP